MYYLTYTAREPVIDSQRRNQEQTRKLFEKYKPTHVIHLAALGASPIPPTIRLYTFLNPHVLCPQSADSSRTWPERHAPPPHPSHRTHSLTHPRTQLDFLRDNILINDNVLHAAHEFKVQKVIS